MCDIVTGQVSTMENVALTRVADVAKARECFEAAIANIHILTPLLAGSRRCSTTEVPQAW